VGWTRRAARYGLYSASPVLPELETEACAERSRSNEWQEHRAQIFAHARPAGYVQEIIAERFASAVP
jgi:hypothetical protein